MIKLLYIFIGLISILTIKQSKDYYNFNSPNTIDILPNVLQEISGLTIIDSSTIACVQDENGILFFYDIKKHNIKKQIRFALNGDYEGITRVNKTIFVLRSDGILYEIKDFSATKLNVKVHTTKIPALNNEGLCYDASKNRLLIGAKGQINKNASFKDERFIYEFNLTTKSLSPEAAYTINTVDFNLSAKLNGIILPQKKNKKGEIVETGFKLNTSEIAIHPINKKLYILSAIDHCLLILNKNGTIDQVVALNPLLFNKAEGLSFFENGDLLISNEGQKGKPTLLKFNLKP